MFKFNKIKQLMVVMGVLFIVSQLGASSQGDVILVNESSVPLDYKVKNDKNVARASDNVVFNISNGRRDSVLGKFYEIKVWVAKTGPKKSKFPYTDMTKSIRSSDLPSNRVVRLGLDKKGIPVILKQDQLSADAIGITRPRSNAISGNTKAPFKPNVSGAVATPSAAGGMMFDPSTGELVPRTNEAR